MSEHRLVADLHLHSRFSMGTSPTLDLGALAAGARMKGIDILAAPDYTHPRWRNEMRRELREVAPGTYTAHGVHFLLVTEVSCVFNQAGRGRRVHLLVAAPNLDRAERFSSELEKYQNLVSDGRPTLGLSTTQLAEIAWGIDEWFEVIPAHIWTPWYGLLGSKSGFDSIDECFGSEVAGRIHAIETGLSSDPRMNWEVPAIGERSIVSFSDAHSAGTMGRELTIFNAEPEYKAVVTAIRSGHIVETIEFHPEHGKYHFDGHRKCGVRLSPEESKRLGGKCPACRRPLTLGVLHRIGDLSASDGASGSWRRSESRQVSFRSLAPLRDVLGTAVGTGPNSRRVRHAYEQLVGQLGGELKVLADAQFADIAHIAGETVALAIDAVRQGRVETSPGFDGQYGTVRPLIGVK